VAGERDLTTRLCGEAATAVAAAALTGLVLAATGAAQTASPAQAPPRPRIVVKPIPFGATRRAETAAYARRHYGLDTWRLVHPRVIVEHYTAASTFSSTYYAFSSNAPDPELGELPGVCSHFVIDRDGTIYQLVPPTTICRHTVGLNWTAIGIEHVGTSDRQILDDPAQLDASLRLTAWLMSRYGIQLRNVIGHNESLTSPYHRERYHAWRCQTHGDWSHADMQIYRRKLAALARRDGVALGPAARPVTPRC
jgi:N-acetylmuramoyl-L-alanine amidase